MVDYDGNKPGDLFDTMDEAAKDFAEYINAKSIEENREYASYIYTKTIPKTMIKTYSNFSGWGSNLFSWLWNMVFRSGHNEPQVTNVATPLGTLRKYDPSDGTDIVLYTDIPFDSNHPWR